VADRADQDGADQDGAATGTACYVPTGTVDVAGQVVEELEARPHTSSAWGPHMQHGGVVSALLVRALERVGEPDGRRIARLTTELLGVVPVGPVRVRAEVLRPGRRVELVSAELEVPRDDGSWLLAARSSAWRLATSSTVDVARPAEPARALPDEGSYRLSEHPRSWAWWSGHGFSDNLSCKIAVDQQTGSATLAWVRMDVPLVEGEETTPLQRLTAVADSANGVGARLDPTRFTFLNTEVTLHLHDAPHGEWFGIEAESSIGADGVGMSAGVLHTPTGPVGRVAQALLVERHRH